MDEHGRGAEALEAAIGEIRKTEAECPGVWYVSTYGDGEQGGTEFYIVDRNADAISNEAKAYGTEIPDCPRYLLYPMDAERQTRKIIQYEVLRRRTHADRASLREIALDGMEECPEYFGQFPPPIVTPYGHTTRYKVLMNGVFWLQTDCLETALAVAYPVWDDAFSPYVMDLARGDADGFGCLFFPETAVCLAVFELGRTYRAIRECPQIDAAALMNAVYQNFPDYVLKDDKPLGRWWKDAGFIRMTPEAGIDFLLF